MNLHQIILKVAQRCNLNCSYCYMYKHVDQSYKNKPAFISPEILDAVLLRIGRYAEKNDSAMEIILHGGEPLLLSTERFEDIARRARKGLGNRLASLAVQTNAVLVNDDWIELFKKYSIRVSCSIDGLPEYHDLHRVRHDGSGSYHAALEGLNKLWKASIPAAVLCVINPAVSGLATYRHFVSIGATRFNFLFPDACYVTPKQSWQFGRKTPIADYLIPIFEEWFTSNRPDLSIPLFKTLIKRALTSQPDPIPPGYIVIDTDGSILLSDEYKVCGEGVGNPDLNVLCDDLDDADEASLYARILGNNLSLSDTCNACSERSICQGGNIPHRYSRERSFDNPSVWCADHFALASYVRKRVYEELQGQTA